MQDQLRRTVEALAAPGTRQVGSHGHELAKNYLIERLNSADLQPYAGDNYTLPYRVETTGYTNLAGVLPGRDRQSAPILLMAHYDTCGDQPGADDNAAAIATWLSVLQILKQKRLQRDVILLFPDAEEPPRFLTEHMGSVNFYEKQLQQSIHAGLVLDLVGHDVPLEGMEDLVFVFGAESHKSMADLLLDVKLPVGLRNIATLNRYVGDLSDHHVLRENKQPYLFFTCGRWEHYHQESDKPEHLNYAKMERIVQYLTNLIEQLDGREFGSAGFNHDPIEMELQLLNRAIGPYLEQAGIPMNNRGDVQRFVLGWAKQHQL
ncbi:MAG: M28 family peptidase [Candidatus Marinimicrobia bacterium]|nr:M28 family peptidase [Candidatus Neomarinimicrobiota bacterium]